MCSFNMLKIMACLTLESLIQAELRIRAGIAQLAEQLIRNQQAVGSTPIPGSNRKMVKSWTI